MDDTRGLWFATLVFLPDAGNNSHTIQPKPRSDQQLVMVDVRAGRIISSVPMGRDFMRPLVVDETTGDLITTGSDRSDCDVAYVNPQTGKQRCLPVPELLDDATGFVSDYGAAARGGRLVFSQIQPNTDPSKVQYYLVTVQLNAGGGAPKVLWNATLDQPLSALSL